MAENRKADGQFAKKKAGGGRPAKVGGARPVPKRRGERSGEKVVHVHVHVPKM